MRKNIHAIFVISALVALVLCSACVLPFGEQKKEGGGLTQVTQPEEIKRISFEEAKQKLNEIITDSKNKTTEVRAIYYIIGKDVDDSGNAASWVFGINQGDDAKLLVYDSTGWTVFPWKTRIPEKIELDHVMNPDSLFTKNKAVILTTSSQTVPKQRDLELRQGIYTLTIFSNSTNQILTFNSTTGALIS